MRNEQVAKERTPAVASDDHTSTSLDERLEELFQLGRQAMDDCQWEEALDCFRMALTLAPNNYSAGAMAVMALFQRYEDALHLQAPCREAYADETAAACRQFLLLYPDCAPVLSVLGRVSRDEAMQAKAYLVSVRGAIQVMHNALAHLDLVVQLEPPSVGEASPFIMSLICDLAHYTRGLSDLYATDSFDELPPAYGWPQPLACAGVGGSPSVGPIQA